MSFMSWAPVFPVTCYMEGDKEKQRPDLKWLMMEALSFANE